MSEPENPLPDALRKQLKNSPTHTPPEQFYQSVLRKIHAEDEPVRKPWFSHLFLGMPVRLAAGTLVLMISIWAVKDQTPWGPKKAELAYNQFSSVSRAPVMAEKLEPAALKAKTHDAVRSDASPAAPSQVGQLDIPHEGMETKNRATEPALSSKLAKKEADWKMPWQSTVQAKQAILKDQRVGRAEVAIGGAMAEALERAPQEWSGVYSAIEGRREVVVENETQWAALWKEHNANRIPVPPLPEVDFRESQIVGVWTGLKPSTGYTVRIVEIRDEGSRRRVIYKETTPSGIAGAAMTQPFILRVIPRNETTIRFEIQS